MNPEGGCGGMLSFGLSSTAGEGRVAGLRAPRKSQRRCYRRGESLMSEGSPVERKRGNPCRSRLESGPDEAEKEWLEGVPLSDQ